MWRRPDLRILDAGGGTGDSTLTLAQQLHDIGNLDARIVHLDLSPTSQAITKERAEYHEIGHMVEFALGSFLDEDLMASLGTFDFIVCHGVLHHQADPGAGLRALKLALRPGGAINIMVYGDLGRTGIYDVQRMMRLMKESESSDEQWSPQLDEQEEVDSLRDLLGALPETSRVRRNEPFWKSVEGEVATGAGAFDLFLHSQDRAYTVRELYEWVEGEAGLTMVGFNEGGLYKPSLWLSPSASDELLERVNDLDERRKMDMAELLHGAIQRHSFYVEDGEKREIPEVMPMAIPCLPRRGQVSSEGVFGRGFLIGSLLTPILYHLSSDDVCGGRRTTTTNNRFTWTLTSSSSTTTSPSTFQWTLATPRLSSLSLPWSSTRKLARSSSTPGSSGTARRPSLTSGGRAPSLPTPTLA